MGTNKRLVYLSLQSIGVGQAAHSHVGEIVSGLRRRAWKVALHAPTYSSAQTGVLRRISEFALLNGKAIVEAVRSRPDAIYIRGHFAALPTALAGRVLGIPTVQELNGPIEDTVTVWPWMRPFRRLLSGSMTSQVRMADLVIANTAQLRDKVRAEWGRPAEAVPNGANVDVFRPGTETALDLPEKFAFFFGAFSRWQGIGDILAALQLPEWPADVSVVFAGDGQLRPEIEEASRHDRRVRYLGVLSQDQIAGVLGRSILGLCPKSAQFGHSKIGASPLKLYEILASERPVVVTRLPGQFELVEQSKSGVVIDADDPRSLAKAVAHLASHPEEREAMGRRGRAAVVAEHSWDRRAADTEQLLVALR